MQKKPSNNKEDASQSSGMLSTAEFFGSLNKYIPSLVVQNWVEKQTDKDNLEEQQKKLEQRLKKNPNNDDIKYKISLINQQLLKHKNAQDSLPYIQDMETVVLFADISGFTKVGEACNSLGIRGREELAFCINRYMEGCIKHLSKYGGDVIKFVGDAMIVMWPTPPREKKGNDNALKFGQDQNDGDDERVNTIRKAIQCSFDIQKEMDNKKITANVTSLSVKLGIGYGKCSLLYVGGLFNRSEYMTVGNSLMSALGSEGEATEGGQIIVSDTAFKYVKDKYYEGVEIISDEGKKFYRVTKVREGIRGRADAVLLKQQIKLDRIVRIQNQLKSCVPNAIMPYLEIGLENYGSETRAVTVMFCSLGIDLSSATSREGINKIQKVVTSVQQMVYRLEGSVNKLMMDDKGSTLICIWGLCPLAHSDDPQRAIFTAINMRKELQKIENTWVSVGISTGDVFTGVVGTSGNRKEFSVLGDAVNLAARIMAYPMKKNKVNCINVCQRTKDESTHQLNFNYGGHCEFKGKSISIPIFEVVEPKDELIKPRVPQQFLKLSYNPIVISKQVNHKRFQEKFVDKSGFVGTIYENIKSYFFRQQQDPDRQARSIIIQGDQGSGKTHAVRTIVEKMQKDQEFVQDQQMRVHNQMEKTSNLNITSLSNNRLAGGQGALATLPIFAGAVNSEQKLKFLGIWYSILRMMFDQKRKQTGIDKIEYFKLILQDHYEKVDLLGDIFGIEQSIIKQIIKSRKDINQIKMTSLEHPYHFLVQENYESNDINCVLDLIVEFVKDFIGIEQYEDQDNMTDCEYSERNKKSYISSKQSESSESYDFGEKKNTEKIKPTHRRGKTNFSRANQQSQKKLMLIFDNASHMNGVSFSLLLRVWHQCPNIVVMIITKQDYQGNPILPMLEKFIPNPQAKQKIIKETFYSFKDQEIEAEWKNNSVIYDVPRLEKDDLKKIFIELAPKYNESWTEEMMSWIEIVNPQTTIKTVEKGEEWRNLLTKLWNLGSVFTNVEDKVIDLIQKKCDGNPLTCMQFFLLLIQDGFLQIDQEQKLISSEKLNRCIALKNFTSIPVPSSAHKNRLKDIDNFMKAAKRSDEKNPKKKEMTIKGIIVMKSAAVIGEDFGTMALKQIMPLRYETNTSLLMILKLLEQYEFIEILDESDSKDIICRFNRSFLRESLYQIMLYKDQKQVLHRQYADHMMSLPVSYMDQQKIDLELTKLKDHVMKGEDVTEEADLPYKHKQGLIIKQMQFQLLTNNTKRILHQGWMFKEGKGANKKISKRLFILTAKDFSWYHDEQEYVTGQQALGLIKIESIYKVNETLLKERTYDLELCITSQYKYGKLIENQPRVIRFGCVSDDERQGWISRIEFLKTKVVYDTYVNKFVNIQFPLKKIDESEENEDQSNDQIIEKLSKFGQHFKQNVRINHKTLHDGGTGKGLGLKNRLLKQSTKLTTSQQPSSSLKKLPSNPMNLRQSFISYGIQQEIDAASDSKPEGEIDNAKQMVSYLRSLYRTSMVCFVNQTCVNSNKSQNQNLKNKSIGNLPEYLDLDNEKEEIKMTTDESDAASFYRNSQRENRKPDFSHRSRSREDRSSHSGMIQKIEELSEKTSSNEPTPQSRSKTPEVKVSNLGQNNENFGGKKRVQIQQRQSEQISKDGNQKFVEDLTDNVHLKKSHDNLVTGDSQDKTSNSGTQVSMQIRNLENEKKIFRNSHEEKKHQVDQHRFTFNQNENQGNQQNQSAPMKTQSQQVSNPQINMNTPEQPNNKQILQESNQRIVDQNTRQILQQQNRGYQQDSGGVYNTAAMKQSINSSTNINIPHTQQPDFHDKSPNLEYGQRHISPIDGISSIQDRNDNGQHMRGMTQSDIDRNMNMTQILGSGQKNARGYHQQNRSQVPPFTTVKQGLNYYDEPQQITRPHQQWPTPNNQNQNLNHSYSFPSQIDLQNEINRQINLGMQQMMQEFEQKLNDQGMGHSKVNSSVNLLGNPSTGDLGKYNNENQLIQSYHMGQQQFNDESYSKINMARNQQNILNPRQPYSNMSPDQNEQTQRLYLGNSFVNAQNQSLIQGGVGSKRKHEVVYQDPALSSKQSVVDDEEPMDPELDAQPTMLNQKPYQNQRDPNNQRKQIK